MPQTTTTDPQTRPAALDQDYVVGGDTWWYRGVGARGLALPHAIDDVSRDFGDDVYDRVGDDSQASACDTLFRASVAEDSITLSPAVDEEGKDGYDQAVKLVEFCEPQLEDLETSLDDVIWDMLASITRGNRIAEITYHDFDSSPLPGRAVLRSLTVKPRASVAFVVDPYMRTIGMMGRQQGQAVSILPGALVDPKDARVIDREKFAVATFRPVDNDPRGTSVYRPAYTPWWLKMQAIEDFRKYLAQFATPLLVGTTAPGDQGAKPDPQTGELVRPVDALLKQLLQLHNSTAIALANGSTLELLFSQGEGKAFLNAFNFFNAEITKAITTQTLASNEGDTASRAQASVHQDALGTIVRQAKRSICRMVRRDVLRNLVRYNFGDKAIPLTPKVSLGEVEQEDIAKLMTAVAQLMSASYIHESQFAGIDRRLNLPPRIVTEEETKPQGEQGDQQQQGQQGDGQQGQQAEQGQGQQQPGNGQQQNQNPPPPPAGDQKNQGGAA